MPPSAASSKRSSTADGPFWRPTCEPNPDDGAYSRPGRLLLIRDVGLVLHAPLLGIFGIGNGGGEELDAGHLAFEVLQPFGDFAGDVFVEVGDVVDLHRHGSLLGRWGDCTTSGRARPAPALKPSA